MRNNALIQMMSGRYYQGCGVLDRLGSEAALLGKRALIVCDRTVWPKVQSRVQESLDAQGVTYAVYTFSGLCSPANYLAAVEQGQGCALVIGIGGGRAVDAAKIAADKLGVRVITVPTSASTCAATAWLAVHYEDDGHFLGNYWSVYSPFATLVDLDVVALDCPQRYLVAGIIDAMAKYPEILYNNQHLSTWEVNVFSHTAATVAKENFRLLLERGGQAMEDCAAHRVTRCVEDVICDAISVTGLTSVLACGGKQAAVSHSVYAWLCNEHPELSRRFVHGELVGATLPYQMLAAGIDGETVEAFVRFCRAHGAPVCLEDLGLSCDEREMERLFGYLRGAMPIEEDAEYRRLWDLREAMCRI